MARTGSALAIIVLLGSGASIAAEPEFYMAVDRTKVGTEDTFRCEIVVSNAPEGAVVQFPAPNDFEVLSKGDSTQMSYSVGPGGLGQIKQVRKYTLVMRANRVGTLTIPAAGLQTANRTYKTEAIKIEVVAGRLAPDPRNTRKPPANPFGLPPGFPFGGLDDDDDPLGGINPFDPFGEDPGIPKSDSDLFLRATLDRPEVYVGEQVTLSLLIYARMNLVGVDSVTMPKLEGFLSQDLSTPTNLAPEARTVGGVQYNAYLLRSKALFPMKAGEIGIEAAEADIASAGFPYNRKIHRKANTLTLRVKPLPKNATNVGKWRLSSTANQTDLALGEPVQLKVILEGRGNLKAVTLPSLQAPQSFRVFDPQQTEKATITRNQYGGQRVVEYVLVPQQTGRFELPGLTLEYFDPESQTIEKSSTDSLTITVRPSGTNATAIAVPGNPTGTQEPTARNQLVGGGLKSLRHTAAFSAPKAALWSRAFFLPAAIAPAGLGLLLALFAFVRGKLGQEDEASKKNKQAKAARRRLAQAEKVSHKGGTTEFYGEVDKALRSFLEARLSQPVTGLTRPQLDEAMKAANVSEAVRQRVLGVFETCDLGRYAPGMGDAQARRRALEDAVHAMEVWP